MNIFRVDNSPEIAAQMLCDKHVVKMVLESAQMLSTAYHVKSGRIKIGETILYKPSHQNHPCNIWIRESARNYEWLSMHALALAREYTFRYGKEHKSTALIRKLEFHMPFDVAEYQRDVPTPFRMAIPDQYKISDDPVRCYRAYYNGEKLHMAKWTKREIPDWIIKI